VPVADVRRRLFHWSPVEADIQAVTLDQDGVATYTDTTRKAIVRPDTGAILGIFRTGYKVHDYDQWLINNVEGILDADLHIGSAGLLRGGAVAWVQVEMADTLNAAGVEFRPFLTATTSLDGSIATPTRPAPRSWSATTPCPPPSTPPTPGSRSGTPATA
jgi:hypothetical protein